MATYIDKNRETIERWIEEGWQWAQPISHETFLKAIEGDFELFLTPTIPVPKSWLGDLKGKKVLGLASGGGQQGPLLVAQGAKVTIIDFSASQIKTEQSVAKQEGYDIETIQADISQPLPFDSNSFDLIIHPVSNVYIKKVQPIWKECHRILKVGGKLLSGLDNGVNYIVDSKEEKIINFLPFDPLKNKEHAKQLNKEEGGIQFSHSIEEQIGGQLKAGFTLLDIFQDTNGSGRLHELNIPSFWATRSQK